MYKYVAQSIGNSNHIITVNPLSYYNKYILNNELPNIYKNFTYKKFSSILKYNQIDSKCPFVFYNDDLIIEIKVSELTKEEKKIYYLHKKVKHFRMPWWKNIK